jgi:thiol-disulfide isomerase/thioredoxin
LLKNLIKHTVLLLALFFTMVSPTMASVHEEIEVGGFLREATLHAITGKSHPLSYYRGKPLFINIWASWCGPCRKEMQSLEQLSRKNNRQQFNIIGISTDDDASDAASLVHEAKLSFKNYVDRNLELENMFGANAIPLTILVDANGRILKKITGSKNWNSPEFIHLIEQSFQITLK